MTVVGTALGARTLAALIAALAIVELVLAVSIHPVAGIADGFRTSGSQSYERIAKSLVENGTYSSGSGVFSRASRPPAYPMFLGQLMRLTPSRWPIAAMVLQGLMNLCVAFLVVSISSALFRDPFSAGIAGALFLFHVSFHVESLFRRETVLFTLIFVAFIRVAIASPGTSGKMEALGMLAGMGYLTRPTAIVLVAALVPLALLELGGPAPRGSAIRRIAVASMLLVAVTLPYQLYLHREFSRFTPLDPYSRTGRNLYVGNNPDTLTFHPYIDVDAYEPWVRTLLQQEGIDAEFEASAFLRARAIDYVREQPVAFLRRALVNLLSLYSPIRTPLGTGTLVERDGVVTLTDFRYQWTRSRGALAEGVVENTFVAVMLIGAAGSIVKLKARTGRERLPVLIILGLIGGVTALHMSSFAESRYRMPFDPALIVLAGDYYASRLRSRPALARFIRGATPRGRP